MFHVEYHALLRCQLSQRPQNACSEFPSQEFSFRVVGGPVVGDLVQQVSLYAIGVSFYRVTFSAMSSLSQIIKTRIGGDSRYPRGKCAIESEAIQLLVNL